MYNPSTGVLTITEATNIVNARLISRIVNDVLEYFPHATPYGRIWVFENGSLVMTFRVCPPSVTIYFK